MYIHRLAIYTNEYLDDIIIKFYYLGDFFYIIAYNELHSLHE